MEELEILEEYLKITDEETKAKRLIREENKKLQKKVQDKYKRLSKEEIQDILVNDKWLTSITNKINSEMDESPIDTTRMELADRYKNYRELRKYKPRRVKSHLKGWGLPKISCL